MPLNLSEFQRSKLSSAPHFLLLGNPVGHSLSPLMHNRAAACYGLSVRYYAVQLKSDEFSLLAGCLNNPELKGLNVTVPYKKTMLEYVGRLDAIAGQVGALNTVVKKDGQLIGYNTDVDGFLAPLVPLKDEIKGGRAIIFGAGGAARAIVFALKQAGMDELVLVSRNPGKQLPAWPKAARIISYDVWPDYAPEASLLVNATPLGMAPDEGKSPVKDEEITHLSDKICYDIVYNPVETAFLKQAGSAGARTIGGLEMFIQQGSRSFELWTGKPFPIQKVRQTLTDHLNHAD